MDFLKNHYEKILLIFVLLGLAIGAALLSMKAKPTVAIPLPPTGKDKTNVVDALKTNRQMLLRIVDSNPIILGNSTNRLFNPVQWVKSNDGTLSKNEGETGALALKILSITNLYFVISYDGVAASGDSVRYQIGVTREAAIQKAQRRKASFLVALNESKEFFTLRKVNGPPENPSDIVIELPDKKEVSITTNMPYLRVEGYMADLRYSPEDKSFRSQREKDIITFGGDQYNIIEIDTNGIVLSSKATNKRTTIKYHAAP